MTRLLLLAITVVLSLVQVGVLPVLAAPAAAPLLPVALVAAWGLVRQPSEVAPALLLAAVLIGVSSEARVGWVLLALLPTAALVVAARTLANGGALRAPAVAALGAALYAVTLTLSTGAVGMLPGLAGSIIGGAALTALLALGCTILVRPLRTRPAGLFE